MKRRSILAEKDAEREMWRDPPPPKTNMRRAASHATGVNQSQTNMHRAASHASVVGAGNKKKDQRSPMKSPTHKEAGKKEVASKVGGRTPTKKAQPAAAAPFTLEEPVRK